MNFRRMWALFVARNYEFTRDRAGFGWNILFPFLIVAGFGLIFSSDARAPYKLGVFPLPAGEVRVADLQIPDRLKAQDFLQIVPFETKETGLDRLLHHKIDLLMENRATNFQYWVNDASPKGQIVERVVREAVVDDQHALAQLQKQQIHGKPIRYIDWLFPGILGMNIMFSSLFGVGFVIVRYRRTGVLKRLKATPVTAFEYLAAQMISRVLVLLSTSAVVWFGADLIFHFQMNGSYLDILCVYLAGTLCLISVGLIFACRGTNEELTNGLINFVCWPMMFLSEVWFSIEGASPWVKSAAKLLPLTHFLNAARKVINDGATLMDVTPEILIMLAMTAVFMTVGSFLFSWTR